MPRIEGQRGASLPGQRPVLSINMVYMIIKTLKIYIEPASLPLTQNIADYVNHIHDDGVYSILMFQRLGLDPHAVNNGRTVFVGNVNDALEQKLDSIARFVLGRREASIEIHTNIYRAYDILFPLLKKIIPDVAVKNIRLNLYDDGIYTLQQRLEMSRVDGSVLHRTMQERAALLCHNLLNREPAAAWPWSVVDNFIWHYFMDTRYHLMQPLQPAHTGSLFFAKLQPAIVPLHFDKPRLASPSLMPLWDSLFNLQDDLRRKLTQLANNDRAMLVFTGYCPEPQRKTAHHHALIEKLSELKMRGDIPDGRQIVYKGHPENRAFNGEIQRLLGEEITVIPDAVPMEYLHMAGLLPQHIGGYFGTSFYSLQGKRIKFVLMEGDRHSTKNRMLLDINALYQGFDENKVVWLT